VSRAKKLIYFVDSLVPRHPSPVRRLHELEKVYQQTRYYHRKLEQPWLLQVKDASLEALRSPAFVVASVAVLIAFLINSLG
jgi:hypothetical protein